MLFVLLALLLICSAEVPSLVAALETECELVLRAFAQSLVDNVCLGARDADTHRGVWTPLPPTRTTCSPSISWTFMPASWCHSPRQMPAGVQCVPHWRLSVGPILLNAEAYLLNVGSICCPFSSLNCFGG